MSGVKRPEIILEVGGSVDEMRVTLGVHGPDVDPTEISRQLGCIPTRAHRRGDARHGGVRLWPAGAWLLSVSGRAPMEPDELVESLLSRVSASSAVWEQLNAQYKVSVSFGIFIANWNRGFALAPATVGRLAAIGVTLEFDIYADLGDEHE
jgi:hypothetical protein